MQVPKYVFSTSDLNYYILPKSAFILYTYTLTASKVIVMEESTILYM